MITYSSKKIGLYPKISINSIFSIASKDKPLHVNHKHRQGIFQKGEQLQSTRDGDDIKNFQKVLVHPSRLPIETVSKPRTCTVISFIL